MFTGLIEGIGTIGGVQTSETGCVLAVATPLGGDLAEGDSIAVNGVCLTVTTRDPLGFDAQVSPQTLRVTTLGGFVQGRVVNLERPLRADARLGGHFVLGHVDGVGRIRSVEAAGDCYWLDVEAPLNVARYLIDKGSIAIDGISLTIARVQGATLGVQIVPFTWAHTALSGAQPGNAVNLEADVLGKYVARLMDARTGVSDALAKSAGTL